MEKLVVSFSNFTFEIHQSIVIWIVTGILVTTLLCIVGSKFKKADYTKAPTGIVLIFEVIVSAVIAVIGGNLKHKTWKYVPFMGSVMIMMVLSNLMGLIGLQPPTSNLSVNVTLTLMMVTIIHFTDIKLHGVIGKLKSWCEPIPILLPLNIIGDLAYPLSLTLRLFGNMLGGSIIIALLYALIYNLLPYSIIAYAVTPFLHMYFDIFAAFMQTYIYFTLSSFFLSGVSDID